MPKTAANLGKITTKSSPPSSRIFPKAKRGVDINTVHQSVQSAFQSVIQGNIVANLDSISPEKRAALLSRLNVLSNHLRQAERHLAVLLLETE